MTPDPTAQIDLQCNECGRDAVPDVWVTDEPGVYCENCIDLDDPAHTRAVGVPWDDPLAQAYLNEWRAE